MVYVCLLVFMIIGALFIKNDAWSVIISTASTLAYFIITKGYSWESLLWVCLLAILVIKHFEALHSLPNFRGRLVRMFQER